MLIHFQALMVKKLRYKYYNKRITTRDNDNVESHDQEESKLNNTINANIGVHTLTYDKIISPFNKTKKIVLFPKMQVTTNLYPGNRNFFLFLINLKAKSPTFYCSERKKRQFL